MAVVKISEGKAREMFAAMGYPSKDWTTKRLANKLDNVVELESKAPEPLEGDAKRVFLKITEALAEGDEVQLELAEQEETPVSKNSDKVEKNGKPEATKNKSAKTKQEKADPTKDPFGFTKGQIYAEFNRVLTGEPQTMKQLMTASGQKVTFYVHMKMLVERGLMEKTNKGYKLTKEGQKKLTKELSKRKDKELVEV